MEIKALYPGDPLWETVADFAENCLWPAGKGLAQRMRENDFHDWECVLAALDGEEIAGFCTLSRTDCLPRAPYCPYVGYVYVDLPYRGNRLSGSMIDAASRLAREAGFDRVFLVSDHVGLYEKYGFTAVDRQPAPWNPLKPQTIFTREMDRPAEPPHGVNVKSMLALLVSLLAMIAVWFVIGKLSILF